MGLQQQPAAKPRDGARMDLFNRTHEKSLASLQGFVRNA
jgi:hypothetical protein